MPWWIDDPQTDAECTASSWLFRNDPELAEQIASAPAKRERARAWLDDAVRVALTGPMHARFVEYGR